MCIRDRFSGVYVGGNDIFEVMIALNLTVFAIIVLGLNIWTTNDNALYSAGLGLANIFQQKKKPMVLISGIIGTILSVWLYYNFCNWLNVLNCTLPPVGIILVLSYFMNKKDYENEKVYRSCIYGRNVGSSYDRLWIRKR